MKIDNPKVTGELTLVGGGSSTLSGSFSGSFQGDGSGITGVVTASYAENASGQVIETPTVTQSFSSVTSVNVNHGFDTRNVLVSVYDDGFSQFMPDSITLTDTNNVDIEFISQRSGIVVVAKGGHIVSGSTDNAINLDGQPSSFYLDYDNFTNTPTDFSGSFSGSFQGNGSELTNIQSSSYAVTASHVTDVDTTNITAAEKIVFDTTGNEEFGLPIGTTAQRPTNPNLGYMRYNTDEAIGVEVYNGSRWYPLGGGFAQLALEVAQSTVTANDAVFIPSLNVEYLVIAGGGGGGVRHAGGGGAGGYRSSVQGESSGGGASAESVFEPTLNTSYTVTVGAGGSAGTETSGHSISPVPTNGSNSVFSTITSIGGGFGGSTTSITANSGGSGGGGGETDGPSSQRLGASGTSNQGYAGGNGSDDDYDGGGGGGGAGSAGENAEVDGNGQGGDGGIGVESNITGTPTYRAGGGGGGAGFDNSTVGGTGGQGGGGNGDNSGGGGSQTTSGSVNTGGGGGAHSTTYPSAGSGSSGAGGSGVVILRYPSNYSISVGAGLTASTSTVGANKVTTFTAGTDTISFS